MSAFLFEIMFLSLMCVMNTWVFFCVLLLRCPLFFVSFSHTGRMSVFWFDQIKEPSRWNTSTQSICEWIALVSLFKTIDILCCKNLPRLETHNFENLDAFLFCFLKDVTWAKELKSMNQKSIYYFKKFVKQKCINIITLWTTKIIICSCCILYIMMPLTTKILIIFLYFWMFNIQIIFAMKNWKINIIYTS